MLLRKRQVKSDGGKDRKGDNFMAKTKNVKTSNARHRLLENRNLQKLCTAHDAGDAKWVRYSCNSAYHRSVVEAQTRAGRVLTTKERKIVYAAVERSGGRSVTFCPPKS